MKHDDPRHGTLAGYSKHYRDGEPPCEPCRAGKYAAQTARKPEDLALTGGHWEPRGLVQVWVADPDAPSKPDAFEDPIEPAPIELPEGIACGRCFARVTESCRSRNGISVGPHADRRIPRQCPCGGPVEPKCRLCKTCAEAARIETQRRYDRNRADQQRVAA